MRYDLAEAKDFLRSFCCCFCLQTLFFSALSITTKDLQDLFMPRLSKDFALIVLFYKDAGCAEPLGEIIRKKKNG